MTRAGRIVIVGRNSRVWQALRDNPRLTGAAAISHADIDDFAFRQDDSVFILSYSRRVEDNRRMFERLRERVAGARFTYFTTATANVDAVTRCYEYPAVKRTCEEMARTILGARIVAIGVVFDQPVDLPGGTTMATSLAEIAAFMTADDAAAADLVLLFRPHERPFASGLERRVYIAYGLAQRAAAGWPCLLRPADFILRALGWRWYGYLYLSNRLWLTTRS